jgi:hypothetical protein
MSKKRRVPPAVLEGGTCQDSVKLGQDRHWIPEWWLGWRGHSITRGPHPITAVRNRTSLKGKDLMP